MDTIHEDRVKIQPLNAAWYGGKVASLDLLRLDLLHPVISGNKWYKLKLNILYAQEHGFDTILTFGGGFSNHLVATSYAAKMAGLKSIGIVRGQYDTLTPTLADCHENGMELQFVTKQDYDRQGEPEWEKLLAREFDHTLIIPEGGDNEWGRKGAALICRYINQTYTHIAVSVGSGTTLTGVRRKAFPEQTVLGFAPMKGGAYLKKHISKHLNARANVNWDLFDTWHFGGFAKWNAELLGFMNDFYAANRIPLDVVYTGKMMYGIRAMIDDGYFKDNDKILCIHTGGLQGNVMVKELLDWKE